MKLKKKNDNIFFGKKAIVTGHTGFKGSWLSYWLYILGAKVIGVSNTLETNPSHFSVINLKNKLQHKLIDIRNKKKIINLFKKEKPDFVFHLAAQALVKKSYDNPIYTWESNLFGTLNILEGLNSIQFKKKCVSILITSDKSYKNLEQKKGYKEDDLLGGNDPYSASKASADIAINSYFNSFFLNRKSKLRIGVARAGNVIGGGDWSDNRLIPDCIKSWTNKKIVKIRNPNSTRPWQHVLEAISGYIKFSEALYKDKRLNGEVFNFGPKYNKNYSVKDVVKEIKKNWPEVKFKIIKNKTLGFYESSLLKLNCTKAKKLLNWSGTLTFKENIKFVAEWYKNFLVNKKNAELLTRSQIQLFSRKINKK